MFFIIVRWVDALRLSPPQTTNWEIKSNGGVDKRSASTCAYGDVVIGTLPEKL